MCCRWHSTTRPPGIATTWPMGAAFEVLARRLQLIEEVRAESPAQPSWEGASHYMGSEERRGGALMDPQL
eukprot:10075221-Alexandrium_andersonii.AAC.1